MFSIYKNRKKTIIKSPKVKNSSFKKQLINNYQQSGLGFLHQTISIKSSIKYLGDNFNISNKHIYNDLNSYIGKFISIELQNRHDQPIIDMLREISIELCIPHLLHNPQHNLDATCEVWNQKKDMILNKIKFNQKLNTFEKIHTPFPYILAYSLIRCRINHKLIIIPLRVNVNFDHANLLIIDLRHPEEDITTKRTIYTYKTYLFEPNGIKYSYQYHNANKIISYTDQANLILKKLESSYKFKSLEVIGGDYGGLQTSLGEETVDFFGRYKRKEGYPICGAIGYWIICFWLYSYSYLSLPQFINQQINQIQHSGNYRDELKNEIFDFIKDMRLYQEQNFKFQVYKTFFTSLKLFITENPVIIKFIKNQDYYKQIEIKFDIQLSYSNPKFNNQLIFKILFKDKQVTLEKL